MNALRTWTIGSVIGICAMGATTFAQPPGGRMGSGGPGEKRPRADRPPPPAVVLAAEFNTVDSDQDGLLSATEIEAFFMAHQEERSQGGPEVDARGQGRRPRVPPDPAVIAEQVLDRHDTDGDGQLSESELTTAVERVNQFMQNWRQGRGPQEVAPTEEE